MTKLKPFQSDKETTLEAKIGFNGGHLEFSYCWSLNDDIFPTLEESETTDDFQRRIGLWEDDCLEAFLARKDKSNYYEFNFSLTHNQWNCFELSSYRFGLKESKDFKLLKKTVTKDDQKCTVTFLVSIENSAMIFMKSMKLTCNLCAISNNSDQGETFWAINHPEDKPDFHNKEFYSESEKLSKGV